MELLGQSPSVETHMELAVTPEVLTPFVPTLTPVPGKFGPYSTGPLAYVKRDVLTEDAKRGLGGSFRLPSGDCSTQVGTVPFGFSAR